MNEIGCEVKALVVLPVQELAAQVTKVFKRYCAKTTLRVALLGGSIPLHQEQQNIVKYSMFSVFHCLYWKVSIEIFMLSIHLIAVWN